ncbi:MAG: hypothetical protein IJL67_02490, partial [Oscillospiraceae bacterium]|nr:hypothetical protein [Oscillospiraceae bacterium]
MDIKRSERIRKTAAIAALVLVVGTSSVAAEFGNSGVFSGDVVNAITINEKTDYEITSEAKLEEFLAQNEKKRGIITRNFEVTKTFDALGSGKTLYGDGKTITLAEPKPEDDNETEFKPKGIVSQLFNTIEDGATLENVVVKTAAGCHIESQDQIGAVCCVNNGTLHYVTVDAVVYSAANNNHDSAPAGIICGENNGTIFGCIAGGILETRNNNAGSLCGINTGIIERCTCSADIRFFTASVATYTVKPGETIPENSDNKTAYFNCLGYDGKYYHGTYSSSLIGGLCGTNNGKIYDCIFEGYLPHEEWTASQIKNSKHEHASNYRERKIGAFSGNLEANGYIKNSLYNGRVKLNAVEYAEMIKLANKDGIVENVDKAPKDYYCNGNYGATVKDRMANTFRLDTYTYEDENGIHTIICHTHYHDREYANGDLTDISVAEYKGDNKAKARLNAGTDNLGPTGEKREGDIWIAGKIYPQLNLKPDEVVAAIEANDRIYDGTTKPLINSAAINKGYGTIKFTLTPEDKESWSEDIPKATNAGIYNVYYKVEGGEGYKDIPDSNAKPAAVETTGETTEVSSEESENKKVVYPSVEVTISPRKLKIKDVEVSYTGKPHTITPEIDKDYTSAEEPDAYGLVAGETCEMTDIHFMQGGEDKEVKDKGEYTITAKPLENNNYVFEDGKVRVTDSAAVSISAPTATAITYGDKYTDSELSAVKENEKAYALSEWKWVVEDLDKLVPDATQNNVPETFKARLKVDGNFNYNLGNGTFSKETDSEGNTYLTTDVAVQVNKRTLNVIWTDPADKKYTYNGNPIYPSYKIEDKNDETKTGYISDADSQKYTTEVKVTSSKLPVDVGSYTATVVFDYDTTQYKKENYVLNVKPKKYHIDKNILTAIEDINIEVPYGKDKEGNVTDIAYIRNQLDKKLKEQIGENYGKYQIVSEFNIKDDEGNNLPDDTLLNVCENTYDCEITYILKNDVKTDANNEGTFTESVKMIPSAAEPKVSAINREYNGKEKDLVKLDNGDCNGLSAEYTVYLKDADGNKTLFYQGTDVPKAINAGTYVVDYSLTCTDGNHTLSDDVASGSVDVTVSPKEVTLEWNGKPQYTYGETVNISAKTKNRDDICDSDVKNGLKLVVAVPDGIVPDDYKATASLDSTNYKVINPEYSYKIVKATLTVTWDETVFTYEPGKQQIPTAKVTGFQYEDKDIYPYHVELVEGDGISAREHEAKVVFDKENTLTKSYNVIRSNLRYKIGEGKSDEIIELPSASPIMYGEYIKDSKLSDKNWKWSYPAVDASKPPAVGTYNKPVERDRNNNYTYPNKKPGVGVTEKGDLFTGNVDVEVNKRPLEVVWGDERSFTYNGEEQYPSFTIKEGDKTGYVDLEDEQKYTVKVVPAKGYDGKSAGKQKATVKFSYTDETLPENYYIDVEDVEYNISTATIKDIDKVETKVTYGDDTSSVKAVREALKAEILNKVPDFDNKYVIIDDFSVENMTEDDVLVVDTYSSRIHYTSIKQDAATGETTADNNYEGWFTAKVEVLPKEIEVQWKSNAKYNEESKKNEIPFGTEVEVSPYFKKDALCKNDKNDKLECTVTPEGYGINDYTAIASFANENYTVTNTEYNYSIVKTEADIKITDELKATYGDEVGTVKLPEVKDGKLEWKDEHELVGPVGEQRHIAVFIPDEGSNYKKTEITLTVKVYPKAVRLIWNIDNGHKFTFNGEKQIVTVRPNLIDVYDDDEKAFAAAYEADDLVNAGENHKAVASINNDNYTIVKGTESRTFTILPSDELQPLNYSETYEYGTTAKEIFDDLVEKHFGDFSAFAKQSSVDAKTVEVYKNGKQIDPTKIKKYIEAYSNAQNGLIDMEVVDQLNQLGARIYNKPDFNIMKCYDDYSQIKNLALSNSGRIISFINAGVLPEDSKYQKLVKLFEKYESIRDAENIMQDVGDYKIVVKYNRVADVNDQSIAKFLNLSGNYRPADLTAEIKITPCVIENLYADIESRYYNGDTNVDVNGFTFISKKNGKDKEWTLGGYDASGTAFVSPNAGTKTINTEMTLRNENFCFGYDKAGKPVMTKKFNDVATDGEILKAEWKYTVNLEGFAGDRLSSLVVPGIVHGEFKWNDTNTVIAEGPNVIDASEYTFTPKSDDPFNKNYDVVLTVNVNGVKKPVETIVETQTVVETQIVTAVETVIVTDETKPAETTVNSGDVTSGDSKVTEPAVTDVTADETKASASVSEKAVTTASAETSGAVTTASTESTKQSVTEAITDGSAKTTDLPEITLPASTTDKLMGEVTDAKVIVTKPSETEAAKAETTAKTEDDKKAVTTAKSEDDKKAVTTAKSEDDKKAVTTAKSEDDKKAVTTAKTEDDKKAVTTAVTEETKAAETTVSTATVTLPDTKAVTTAATEETKPSATETTKTDDTKAVTTAATEETKAAETTVSTATVTLPDTNAVTTAVAESTKPSDTTAKTDDNKKAVTTAGDVTTAETTVSTAGATTPVSESAKPAETEATKAATTAKVEDTTTAEATAETTVTTVSDTKAEETTAATTAATEETKTAEPSVTTADVTTEVTTAEVTEAATLPTLPEITMPVVTTDKLMGDVTDAVVTEAVTTPAVTEKADLEKIREIVINEPERVTKEVREDEKISLDGEEIKLALEDKMFFQGTESFDYPVRLKDFNAEKAFFDYAGFGFELPEGFSIDPDSLTTDLKGNIKYYAPDSIEALALAAKTNYTANGGYVVFR